MSKGKHSTAGIFPEFIRFFHLCKRIAMLHRNQLQADFGIFMANLVETHLWHNKFVGR